MQPTPRRRDLQITGLLCTLLLTATPIRLPAAEATLPNVPSKSPDVIYVPTPQPVVDKMLELAEVKAGDVVYDLGCGDGRIVVTAAKKYGVRAIGFDIDPQRVKEANENVRSNKVEHLVTIKQEDIFTLDLREASVVTLYLLPDLNVRLMPQLRQLKPGSRIVSHDFDMQGTKPLQVVEMESGGEENGDDSHDGTHMLYKWVVPWEAESTAATSESKTATVRGHLSFQADGDDGFHFDTGVLRGKLRAGGKARGLTSVEHISSGTRLDRGTGLFGHYRVFTTNKRYGTAAWDWPGEAELRADGSVEGRWPATDERPFELAVTYRWAAPDTLDVITTVQARTPLTGFESFLASYFTEGFTNSLAYVAHMPGKPGEAGFLTAEPSLGNWLAFPRDDAAMAYFRDGRWKIEPNPVEWLKMLQLAKPLGIRRNPATGLTALIMAPPTDAFALCTPQQTEGHYSMYLSLFGRDLAAGETAQARARLVIGSGLSNTDAVRVYGGLLSNLSGN